MTTKEPAEKVVRDIRRRTRRQYSSEEKIRIVLEGPRGEEALAGAFISSDAVLCADDDEFLDDEQGVPHFKGFPGRVVKVPAPANMTRRVLEG